MLLANDIQQSTIQTIVLGFLFLALTVAQTWWQRKKVGWDNAQSKLEMDVNAASTSKKLDIVYEAVNGNGLMGAVKVLMEKVCILSEKSDQISTSFLQHIKEDSDSHLKIERHLEGIEKVLRGEKKNS